MPFSSRKPSPDQSEGQRRLGQFMIYAAWLFLLVLLSLFFHNWLERENNPNRYLVTINENGLREVVLKRGRRGHYIAPGYINGFPVRFLVDTGATDVIISQDVAEQIGLQRGYPSTAQTANGLITVYNTIVDEVRLGNIALQKVRASINPNMHGNTVLLGMSFMKNLELVQRDNTLTIRQLP